jgi:predicted SAM-dependent methyltransferase
MKEKNLSTKHQEGALLAEGKGIKLNLGCGKVKIPGFVGIDTDEAAEPDIVGDVFNLAELRVSPCTVSAIVAYDVIEHFDREEYPEALKSWFDSLAPGGVLYIRTNDLERMIRLYQIDNGILFPAELFVWHLMCEHDKPGMGHKWCFTRRMLYQALLNAGFKKIVSTPEDKIISGEYPYSNTKCDRCNMHMTATKV